MKRLISALLCIAMLVGLFGCKPDVPPPVDPAPPQTVSPSPETTPPATEPVPTPEVTPSPNLEEDFELVYSDHELDVEIYSAYEGQRTALRYGSYIQEIEGFPYNGLRPVPEIWEHDGDNDGTKELYIIHNWGSGTGVSADSLLVCEPNGDKLDYWVHDWKPYADSFNSDCGASYNEEASVVTVGYGGMTLSVPTDPVDQCNEPAVITGEQVDYGRDTGNSIRLTFLLAMTSEDHPMSDFYGINLNVTLAFDGSGIAEVGTSWLSYDGIYAGCCAMSPKETTSLYKTPDGRLILQCGNVGGPINYPADLEYPPFHKDNLSEITLYEPENGGEHPVVLVSAPNAAGEEIFYELRWVQETGSWNLNHFRAAESFGTNRLAFFDHLLRNGALENWYLAAMGSIYDTPAEMDLGLVFYNGFSDTEITPEEKSFLLEQGFSEHIAMHKLPAEKLDEVLNTYFGISLYDVAIPSDWVYYPETDSYYSSHSDAYLVHGFTVMQANVTDEGLIELHYCVEPYRGATDPATGWSVVYGILTLRANNDSPERYTVVSNRSAPPIDALEEEGVYLYALPDGRLFLQDRDTFGPVSYVNDANAKKPGYYDLSQITITRKELLHDWEGNPLYIVILLNVPFGDGNSVNPELWWVEDTGTWELAPFRTPGPLGNLGGEVTKDTIPTDPKQFYRVANCGSFSLYARNHGLESLMTWEGNFWWYLGQRTVHTSHFNLPVMIPLEGNTVAVVSEVQTGTQTGVDELIVYQLEDQLQENGTTYTALNEFLYDWRPIAENFNRNNTLIYDKETNSLTLLWNGEAYFTGTLSNDLSVYLDLEDGFAGALIASGQIVRYEANKNGSLSDGSFTITMQTCVGKGGDGYFSDDISDDPFWYWNGEENYYYGMSAGITGFELTWTVHFTGNGFEVSDMTVAQTGGQSAYLRAAIPAEEIYLFRKPGDVDGKNYLLIDRNIYEVADALHLGDQIVDFRHHDLDGDGEKELALVGNQYAGSGYSSILTILDQTADGWTAQQLWPGGEEYTPPYGTDSMIATATFTVGEDPTEVILHLMEFDFRFLVSDEVAARDGDYYVWDIGMTGTITWDGDSYYLHLPGWVFRSDSDITGIFEQSCDVPFELRCQLNYYPDGTIEQVPTDLMPPYTHFTVTQLTGPLFELSSKNGFVQFEGNHVKGEKILTYRRDLTGDGVEEFIVFLVADNSTGTAEYDVHIFDGKTLEPCDTSDLWDIAFSLFAFTSDADIFQIHCGEFSIPLSKAAIREAYPDIDLLDKVELWGSHSSVTVMYDTLAVEYSCMVGHNRETYGSLRVHLKVENNQLIPSEIEFIAFNYQTTTHYLTEFAGFKPFIGE